MPVSMPVQSVIEMHPKPLRADLVGYVDMYIYHWLIIHVHVELKL